ncbi:MAG: transposase [Chitinispirillales bacterium]|jgi:putative transposase|nr:transposase [Chitinispirillales bacterium]
MLRAHKIRLYPNNKQATYFAKACGISRFAYNWGLSEWKRRHEAGEKVTEGALRKELNAVKHEQFPWMLEVTKCAPQLAIKNDLNSAFKNFFAKRAGFPKFHKKGVHDSFSLSNDQFSVKETAVSIPKLGDVRIAESLRFAGKIMGAAISRIADKWYMAIQVEIPEPEPTHTGENQAVGVDLGIKALATLSDGTVVCGSKASRLCEKKLKRLNQELSRRKGAKKGEAQSNNFKKTKRKIARLYARMANIRMDGIHKLTTMLVKKYDLIGIEDLNVAGMMKNHYLARSIADMSFFEFRRQLEYKGSITGSRVVVADRFFASSKTCNVCGSKLDELALSVRDWTCDDCGTYHDRDVNAAINIRNYAVSSTVSACGELGEVSRSMKQELNVKLKALVRID